ncbi:hypothetical protein Tco_0028618 [Tanacetum coccineum]
MMNLTTLPLSFWDYALESATRILNMVPTKKVDKTPYELWYVEFFEKRLINQEMSRRAVDLEEIQEEEDTTPSEITSNIPQEVEGFEPPQEEVIPIRRSERTHCRFPMYHFYFITRTTKQEKRRRERLESERERRE